MGEGFRSPDNFHGARNAEFQVNNVMSIGRVGLRMDVEIIKAFTRLQAWWGKIIV